MVIVTLFLFLFLWGESSAVQFLFAGWGLWLVMFSITFILSILF